MCVCIIHTYIVIFVIFVYLFAKAAGSVKSVGEARSFRHPLDKVDVKPRPLFGRHWELVIVRIQEGVPAWLEHVHHICGLDHGDVQVRTLEGRKGEVIGRKQVSKGKEVKKVNE
jgi:hypothetical protein